MWSCIDVIAWFEEVASTIGILGWNHRQRELPGLPNNTTEQMNKVEPKERKRLVPGHSVSQ